MTGLDEHDRTRQISDINKAADLLDTATAEAVSILPPPDVILLSGGIDSIIAAAAAARAGHQPDCVTVCSDIDNPDLDGPIAQAAAEALGLDWTPVTIDTAEVADLARRAINRLGGAGLFQVGAEITNLALVDQLGGSAPVTAWSGTGADLLFGPFRGTDGQLRWG
jgi:asparagine synthetase B (glutamine-hydrolysing)